MGYGGTKEEMERLLVDADELSDSFNLQVDASGKLVYSYADIVDAIHIVQDEMGITGTTATEAEKTISGSFNSMKGAWENFMVALVDSEQDAGEAFNTLWESAKTFLGNLAPKIGEVIKSMGAFGVVLLSVSAALVTFKVVNTIVKGLNALKVATESTTIAQALLNKVMNMNPFVLIATLIAGVVTALITLWNTSEGFREAVQEIWEAIINFFGDAWEAIKNIFSSVGNFFVGVWNSITYAFSTVVSFFSGIFLRAWEGITSAFSAVGNFFSGVWSSIKNAFGSVVNFFGIIFSGAWKAIKNAFSGVGKFFGGIWDKIVGTFKTVGTKVADAIGGAFKSAINAVIATIEGALNLIPKAVNAAIGLINKLPGVEISKIPLISLPRLERGGVLKRGQVGLLEGNGAEAVVPLERHTGWINRIAEQLDEKMQHKQSNAQGCSRQSVELKVGIDDSANAMGLARALLPFLKIAEKEVYA